MPNVDTTYNSLEFAVHLTIPAIAESLVRAIHVLNTQPDAPALVVNAITEEMH